jgi:hypothetical protein
MDHRNITENACNNDVIMYYDNFMYSTERCPIIYTFNYYKNK